MKRILVAVASIALLIVAILLSQPQNEPPAAPTEIRTIGAMHPRVSPAGDRVAFSYQGAIWVVPVGGGVMRRLTSGEGFDAEPAWSRDGQRIAFINSRNFNAGALRVNTDDGTAIPIPGNVQAAGKLAFHPDGKRILGSLTSPDLKSGEALAWIDLTTGRVTPVTDPPRPARQAALSADGKWIAFATHQDRPGQQGGNDGPQADLWRVAAEGGKPEKVGQWPARIHNLCFTADGRSVIVTTDVGGAHYDLWQVPLADFGTARRLTNGQADEDRPSVSNDGRWLVYTDNRDGATAMIKRDLRYGEERPVTATTLHYGPPMGAMKLHIKDKATGQPMTARVSLTDTGGKFYAPPGALYRVERGNGHFYGRDAAELRLPAGEYRLAVSRGTEYTVTRKAIRIEEGKTADVRVELERWVDAASFNLYSGENHIHANYGYGEWFNTPETMLLQCEGEDLNVCNFMVANSDTDGVFDRPFFRGRPDSLSKPRTILYWNEEYRSTIWGHLTLLNLRRVVEPIFTGFKDTTNPHDTPTNADTAERTREQGGFVSYTHGAQNPNDPYQNPYTAKGLPIDAALGRIDSMDINNSYAGSVPLWYRLLNCGFRLPASAGTDVFLNRVMSRLPGGDRCYVRIDGELTYAKWIDGLKAGRSFVTNGPMLEIIADGTKRQGDTVRLPGPGKIMVTAKVWGRLPLRKAELLRNGEVVATKDLTGKDHPEEVWKVEIPFEHSGWLALRTSGPSHADNPGGDAFAHTSPIYIEVANKPQPARADAEFFLKWIDRLDVALRERDRFPTPAAKAHAAAQLDAARAVYSKIAAR